MHLTSMWKKQVKNVANQDVKESYDIWWCKEATKEPEWTEMNTDDGYTHFLNVKKDDEQSVQCKNHNILYESNDDNSSIDTKETFRDDDKYNGEDIEFLIPSCYSYRQESVFNMEINEKEMHEINACKHQNLNGWRGEWLLDSGSTVNLTNKKECFWEQRATNIMVMVGDGSQVEGLFIGHVILKRKIQTRISKSLLHIAQTSGKYIKCEKTAASRSLGGI
jgi:hypothetical protein